MTMPSFWETLFSSSKTARIFQMVMTITSWMTGLDKRLASIEARLGSIEIALQGKGIQVPPVGQEHQEPPSL